MIGSVLVLGYFSFYVELLMALLIMMMYTKKRKFFAFRVLILTIIAIPLIYLPSLTLSSFNFSFTLVFLLVFISGFFLYKVKPINLFVLACMGYALQHIAWYVLFMIFEGAFPNEVLRQDLALLMFYCVYIVIYFLMYLIRVLKPSYFNLEKVGVVSIITSFLILIVVIILSAILPSISEWNWITRTYTILSCVFALLVLSGFFELSKINNKKIALENENNELQRLLNVQAKQHVITKSTMDAINFKIHDMKHQINVLRQLPKERQEEVFNDFEKLVDIYGDFAKTGNDILDIILTEKSLICSSKGIKLTYICDGNEVTFIKYNDLTSLIGNILDNAIEATSKVKNPEQKIIKLNISIKKDFLCIHEENYSTESIEFDNGLPLSKKKNKRVHGYGAKSIAYIVSKYFGNLKFNFINNIFSINITIPLPAKDTK